MTDTYGLIASPKNELPFKYIEHFNHIVKWAFCRRYRPVEIEKLRSEYECIDDERAM